LQPHRYRQIPTQPDRRVFVCRLVIVIIIIIIIINSFIVMIIIMIMIMIVTTTILFIMILIAPTDTISILRPSNYPKSAGVCMRHDDDAVAADADVDDDVFDDDVVDVDVDDDDADDDDHSHLPAGLHLLSHCLS